MKEHTALSAVRRWLVAGVAAALAGAALAGTPEFTVENGVLTGVVLNGATGVTVPNGVTAIADGAFGGCLGLKTVTILGSVTNVSTRAFEGCSGLESFSVAGSSASYKSVGGLLLSKDGKTLVHGVNGDVDIPEGVTEIGAFAFERCVGLFSVSIPESVQVIGDFAFGGSGLEDVEFKGFAGDIEADYASVFCDTGFLAAANANDNFADAKEISGSSGAIGGINIFATDEDVEPIKVPIESATCTMWYKWTAPANAASAVFHTCWSDFDTCIGVFQGKTLASLACVAWSDDCGDDLSSRVKFSVKAGQTYFICVSSTLYDTPEYGSRERGDFLLSWETSAGTPVFVISAGTLCGMAGRCPETLVVPYGVTRIAANAFDSFFDSSAENIRTVTIPDSVTSIGEDAFYGCIGLAEVSLPADLRGSIDESSVFAECPIRLRIVYRSSGGETWKIRFHKNDPNVQNGGDVTVDQDFAAGETRHLLYLDSQIGWAIKDEGDFSYIFLGWAKSRTGAAVYSNGEQVCDLAEVGKVMHLYAVWQKRAYQVIFHSNDGRNLAETQEFRPNIAKNLLWLDSGLGWTRSGYDFLGWAKAPTSTAVVYTNGQNVNNLVAIGEKLHLYAVWRDRRWTIRYHRNYDSGDDEYEDQKIPVGASVTLYWLDSQLGWTRNGYRFNGWAKSRTAGAVYQNGQTVKDLVPGGQVLHIYGAWTPKTK